LRHLFGEPAPPEPNAAPAPPGNLFISTPAVAHDAFGWGVIYALHARACIERGRLWQADHYVSAVRDHALSLACMREGVTFVQARGYDDLSASSRDRFEGCWAASVEPEALRAALAAGVRVLMREGEEARLANAAAVARHLGDWAERR
jgi:hypothetical protein